MKKILLIILAFINWQNSKSQSNFLINQSDIDFINDKIRDERRGIKLVSEMSKYDLTELKKYTARQFFINRIEDENGKDISDTIKLTKDDQAVLANQIENLKHFKWSLENSKNLNLPNLDIISLDSSVNSSMQYAIKYHIVPPLYFKDNNYCIFSFSYSCGGLCGHGQITIYKKTGNSWKRWNHLSWWDE